MILCIILELICRVLMPHLFSEDIFVEQSIPIQSTYSSV